MPGDFKANVLPLLQSKQYTCHGRGRCGHCCNEWAWPQWGGRVALWLSHATGFRETPVPGDFKTNVLPLLQSQQYTCHGRGRRGHCCNEWVAWPQWGSRITWWLSHTTGLGEMPTPGDFKANVNHTFNPSNIRDIAGGGVVTAKEWAWPQWGGRAAGWFVTRYRPQGNTNLPGHLKANVPSSWQAHQDTYSDMAGVGVVGSLQVGRQGCLGVVDAADKRCVLVGKSHMMGVFSGRCGHA